MFGLTLVKCTLPWWRASFGSTGIGGGLLSLGGGPSRVKCGGYAEFKNKPNYSSKPNRWQNLSRSNKKIKICNFKNNNLLISR